MTHHAPISSVYRMGPQCEREDVSHRVNIGELRRRLWHELGLALLDPEDMRDDFERQAIINEANRQFGRRSG